MQRNGRMPSGGVSSEATRVATPLGGGRNLLMQEKAPVECQINETEDAIHRSSAQARRPKARECEVETTPLHGSGCETMCPRQRRRGS
jgi:hypothetical protein